MRALELTKINRDVNEHEDSYSNSDDPTERGGEAPAQDTSPVTIMVDSIRCFYPRRRNKPGTRLTFKDGGGFAVTETYEEVKQRVTVN